VSVAPVEGGELDLEVWISHPDAALNPVAVRVWVDSALVLETDLRGADHVRRAVLLPEGAERVVLRAHVSRTWRPADHGGTDTRSLGMAIGDWRAR